MPYCPQVTFLNRILRVSRIAHEIPRQRVDIVEMR
jgi:hypothetical protein